MLQDGTRRIPLYHAGRDAFVTGDSAWAVFPFRVIRENDRVVELVHGPHWFRLVGAGDRPSPPAPWQAFVGHYRGQVSYYSNCRVILRRGELLLVSPEGREEPLVPIAGREFRVGQGAGGVERVRFEDVVSAWALRMSLSGTDYYRSTMP